MLSLRTSCSTTLAARPVGPNTDGPPPLRKMILPALFVGGLFYVSFTRTPPVPPLIVVSGEALGTTWTMKVAEAPSEAREAELRALVETTLAAVDQSMSTYRPDSELMRFNTADGLEPVALSSGLGAVIAEAMDIGEITGGAFDVTVGPLVNAWGFGPDKRRIAPDSATIAQLRSRVGTDKLELTEAGLTKTHPEVFVDLSAIAKGHAVDRVVSRLASAGAKDVLMEVGGEIVARGSNPAGQPWRLGIETPTSAGRDVLKAVSLNNTAMATSGDYRNYYEVDGKRVSHLIDPRSMSPIEHNLASVTVVHQRCSTADAWATALSVLGDDEGFLLAEAQGLQAFFIMREADGSFTSKSTTSFKALEQ